MATLAAFITQAITKVSSDPTYAGMEFETREEARDKFTAALLFELGLAPKPAAVHAPVQESKTEEPPKTKRASKKKSQAAAVAEAPKEVEALTEQVAQLALEEQPTPKKARKTKGNGSGEPVEEPVEKKKPGPKPKAAKVEGPVNLEKLTPTHKKHLKAIAEELKVESRDKEFLAFANGMSAETWGSKALDAHIRDFLTPHPPPLANPPREFKVVEFRGIDYLVDTTTKFVYANSDGPTVKARDHLGVVGVLRFAGMELPEDE
jgi:hypothetical protein